MTSATDFQDALARLGNDRELLTTATRLFIRTAGQLMIDLRCHAQMGALAEVAQMLHTIKGTAGTLGAVALSAAAAHLQTLLLTDRPLSEAQREVEAFAVLLALTTRELECAVGVIENVPASPTIPERIMDIEAADRALLTLDELLQNSAMFAIDACSALQRSPDVRQLAIPARLVAAIETLDFPTARNDCATCGNHSPRPNDSPRAECRSSLRPPTRSADC